MGMVHDIIEAGGKEAALRADIERAVVEAASLYMADESVGMGFSIQAGAKPPYLTGDYQTKRPGRSLATISPSWSSQAADPMQEAS